MMFSKGHFDFFVSRSQNSRWILYGLIAIWVLAIVAYERRSHISFPSAYWVRPVGHPIERLIAEKRQYFSALLARQSQTLPDAITEYKRRYRRDPPDGFDWWFELATEHNFQLIDEFDTFMETLEPYRGISPYILRKRMDVVLEADPTRFARVDLHHGTATVVDNSMMLAINRLPDVEKLGRIPYNATILLNGFDEPAVVADYEEVQDAVGAASRNKHIDFDHSTADIVIEPWMDTGRQSGWTAQAHACSYNSSSRKGFCPRLPPDAPLPFQDNIAASIDVCQNCQLLRQHGILIRPDTMKTARQLVPIFSASRPSHFNDLLYPSLYYDGTTDQYNETLDPDFQEKDNKFYWAGKATGGQVTKDNWFLMQRQRLALKCRERNSAEQARILEETKPGRWTPSWIPMAEIARRYFQVHISGVVQCEDHVACDLEKTAFDLPAKGDKNDAKEEAYKHKFVFDIDGNGFSGRFYRLLRSKSVVVKQTILKEWHDDRLVPWVHYVPLSTGYDELPELARFLAGTEKGVALSETIASESTQWYDMSLRAIDIQLYTIRSFMEFARVISGEP